MSDAFWESFFSNLPQILISAATLLTAIFTFMRVGTVHKQINSRMDLLLLTTAEKSRAEGIKEEYERNKE